MIMPAVVPRWEWRGFADCFSTIAHAAGLPPEAVPRDSDELYLLDARTTPIVKIRDGMLDIKRLRETDDHGLELWEPAFKERFPLYRNDLAAASAVWALPVQDLPQDRYTMAQFTDALRQLRPGPPIVAVHKSRRSFAYCGCFAEWVRLGLGAQTTESFALEHENPARVLEALRRLGLDSRRNTNYPLGLRHTLGLAHEMT